MAEDTPIDPREASAQPNGPAPAGAPAAAPAAPEAPVTDPRDAAAPAAPTANPAGPDPRETGIPQPANAPQRGGMSGALHTLGQMALSAFGKEVQYGEDGKPMVVQQKPGDLFRHILAGALLGSALGSGENSFGKGVARGGAGVMQHNEELDKQKYERAQQGLQNKREQRRMEMEEDRFKQQKDMNSAQVQQWNTTNLWHEQEMTYRNMEFLDKVNQQQTEEQKWVVEHHATLAPLPGNGQAGNGIQLRDYINKNPQAIQSGDKFDIMHLQRVDLSKLQWDDKQGWLDKQTGQKADPRDFVTHYVYQIPKDVMQQQRTVGRKEFKDHTGIELPSGMDNASLATGEYLALQQKHLSEQITAGKEDRLERWDRARVMLDSARTEISELQKQRSDLEGEIKANNGQATAEQTAQKQELNSQVRSAITRYNKSLETIPGMPKLGEAMKAESPAGGGNKNTDVLSAAASLVQQNKGDYRRASATVENLVRAKTVSEAEGEALKKALMGMEQSETQSQEAQPRLTLGAQKPF